MLKNSLDIQKVKECICILLESHRELLSGDEIETLENSIVILEKYYKSLESEARKDKINSFVIEVLAFIAKVAIKIFTEE